MGYDRSEEARRDNLRRGIVTNPKLYGFHLDADEIEYILDTAMDLLEELDYLGAADDSRAINAACDIYEPVAKEVVEDRYRRAA